MKPQTIHAESPLRISFAGGGTDFPHYFEQHGGAVLSAAIDRFARATLVGRDDEQVLLRDRKLGHEVEFHREEDPVFDGVLDLAKAGVARIGVHRGVEIEIGSDAPAGSGVGGAAAAGPGGGGGLPGLGGGAPPARGRAGRSPPVWRGGPRDRGGVAGPAWRGGGG